MKTAALPHANKDETRVPSMPDTRSHESRSGWSGNGLAILRQITVGCGLLRFVRIAIARSGALAGLGQSRAPSAMKAQTPYGAVQLPPPSGPPIVLSPVRAK